MTRRRRVRLAVVAVLAVGQAATGLLVLTAGPGHLAGARAYPASHVDLAGHGFGHGRGMGQYGALGYAVDHGRTYQQILDHYYGGTFLAADLGNPSISVRLTARDGQPMIVTQEQGHLTTSATGGQTFGGVMVTREGSTYRVFKTGDGSPRCDGGAGGWQHVVDSGTPVTASPTADTTTLVAYAQADAQRKEMLQLCRADGTRWYRGTLQTVVDGSGVLRTVNHLPTNSYLVGVVPRESPASWGSLGGGAGMHALRAQAVAARSYATAEDRLPGVAKTCDTISCQVYAGRAEQLAAGFKDLEGVPAYASTDNAVKETSGQIRRTNGSNAVARTEFSSSTGGWTAGGTFPAVADEGDDTSSNPNHNWTARVPVVSVEGKYAKGTLLDVQVTERNGLGADGGRVKTVRLTFSGGTVDRTGNRFRSDFGLKSDWFRIANAAVPGYHTASRDGGVFSFGTARFHGSLPGLGVTTPARDLAAAPGGGYWVLADDGGVFTFGGAAFHGSLGGKRLNGPPRQLVGTPAGGGYWVVADDGGVFTFGDAGFFGSTGAMRLNAPVVGMAPTPSGQGYWLVARDGGVFSFGDARFFGSTGGIRLNRPVNDIAAGPSGGGYWLLAEDGGLFAFGEAPFFGSLPGRKVAETAVDLDASPTGQGYLVATVEGGVHAFGDAGFLGSPASVGARAATLGLSIPR